MRNIRLIPRLDIKGPNLIKGIHLEGLRVIGDPHDYALEYYHAGADELIYMDIVASLYGRNNLSDIISQSAMDIFVPITVGGGIRSTDDVRHILRSGADKVAINTAAVARPELITETAKMFGNQCMVISIEAKKISTDRWEVFTDNGRERTGLDVIEWVSKAVDMGAGEVLLTSVDQEGTRKGFDIDLARLVSQTVSVPVIISGGMGSIDDMLDVLNETTIDAVSMADILHYKRAEIPEIRTAAVNSGFHVRKYG